MRDILSSFLYLIPIALLLLVFFYKKKKHYQVRQWQKSLKIKIHERIFQELYHKENGFLLSQKARQEYDALDYIYGEIKFVSFLALLSLVSCDEKTVFYDLGCGIGKAVLACAMVYPVHKSIGVEILSELHLSACRQAHLLSKIASYTAQSNKIEFILGDFLEINLDNATLIFINSTSIFNPTWRKLCARLENLPNLTTVITTSKALPSIGFEVKICTQVAMSWGVVQAYIHQRKNNNDSPR